ncbi:MAG TPA: hypothetical protein VF771_18140 [Longimicrobiaceae bacterium]
MRLLIPFAIALALSPALPRDGRAQDPRLRGRLDAPTLSAVTSSIDSARAVGLPTEPLVRKALEGARKGADGARIAASVRTLAAHLGVARTALGARAGEAELTSAAAALYVGVRSDDLRRVQARAGGRSTAMAFVALAFLVQQGVTPETSSRLIESLVGARASDDELMLLQRQVAADVGSGAPPGDAAAARARGLLDRHGAAPPDGRLPSAARP